MLKLCTRAFAPQPPSETDIDVIFLTSVVCLQSANANASNSVLKRDHVGVELTGRLSQVRQKLLISEILLLNVY